MLAAVSVTRCYWMIECDGCGEDRDDAVSLVVCRRRYENVCSDCMDVIESALENQRIRLSEDEERLRSGIELLDEVKSDG